MQQVEIEGESADLLYQIGVNEWNSCITKNFFSIIYLNEMPGKFSSASGFEIQITFPTLEAYIDALYSVPKILGGDKKKVQSNLPKA